MKKVVAAAVVSAALSACAVPGHVTGTHDSSSAECSRSELKTERVFVGTTMRVERVGDDIAGLGLFDVAYSYSWIADQGDADVVRASDVEAWDVEGRLRMREGETVRFEAPQLDLALAVELTSLSAVPDSPSSMRLTLSHTGGEHPEIVADSSLLVGETAEHMIGDEYVAPHEGVASACERPEPAEARGKPEAVSDSEKEASNPGQRTTAVQGPEHATPEVDGKKTPTKKAAGGDSASEANGVPEEGAVAAVGALEALKKVTPLLVPREPADATEEGVAAEDHRVMVPKAR